MANLIERYCDRIRAVLSCFDRVVIQGTMLSICHANAMASMLDSRGIRLFDYPISSRSLCLKRFAPGLPAGEALLNSALDALFFSIAPTEIRRTRVNYRRDLGHEPLDFTLCR